MADIETLLNAAAMTVVKEQITLKPSELGVSMKHLESALDKVKKDLEFKVQASQHT